MGITKMKTKEKLKNVYKYNVDECRMIEVGVVDENNIFTYNPPISKEYKYDSLNKVDISLYSTGFYICTAVISRTKWSSNYEEIFPANMNDLKEINTGAEGRCFVVGHISKNRVVFYDQYLSK